MATPNLIDWIKVKNDYINDPCSSFAKIAKKHGISYNAVKRQATKDRWADAKKKQLKKIEEKAAAKLATKSANKLANELEAANLAGAAALRALQDPDQFRRHLVTKTEGTTITTEEIIADKYDARAMKDMLSALKMVEDLKRSIGEIQRQSERQKHDLEQARLELERERLELEKERIRLQNARQGDQAEAGSYGIVLLPGVMPAVEPEAGDPDE